MSLTLTKLSETPSTITLGWTPPAGIGGYVFYANGEAVSTGSPNLKDGSQRLSVKFSKTSPGPPFQVAAVCRSGTGAFSLELGTYTETPPPPAGYTDAASVDLARRPLSPQSPQTVDVTATVTITGTVTDKVYNVNASVGVAIQLAPGARLERCVVNCNGRASVGVAGAGTLRDVAVYNAKDVGISNIKALEGCVYIEGAYKGVSYDGGSGYTQAPDCLLLARKATHWCVYLDNISACDFQGVIAGNDASMADGSNSGISVWTKGIHGCEFNILIANNNPGYGFSLYGGSDGNIVNEVYCDAQSAGGDPALSIGGGAHDNVFEKHTSIGYAVGLIMGEDVDPSPHHNRVKTLVVRNAAYPAVILDRGAYANVVGEVGGATLVDCGSAGSDYLGTVHIGNRGGQTNTPPHDNEVLGLAQSGGAIRPEYVVHLKSGTTRNMVAGSAQPGSWTQGKILDQGSGNIVSVNG